MSKAVLLEVLDFSRQKTLALLEAIGKIPDPAKALAFRPAPGRAPLGWQLMHIGATDDRHVHLRMAAAAGDPKQPDLVRRFAGGSTPDDVTPTLADIKDYLTKSRELLLAKLATVPDADLDKKPSEQAPWTYREWIKVLTWHEAHHQGQAHLTFNMFKAQ